MGINTPSLLTQFYLDKYSALSFKELIKELNEVKPPNKIIKCLIISTRIVFYVTQLIGGNGFKNNLDLQTSAAMSLILRRLKSDEPLKFNEVENIVKTEINFISNMIFANPNIGNVDYDAYYEDTALDDLILDEVKKELIDYVPDNLKLSMYNFIKTSIIEISNYSDEDKHLFYTALEQNGYEVDMEARNYFLELETITEKAIFLSLLMHEQPSLFILFTSLKSMNHIVMLSKYNSLNMPSTLKLMGIFEDIYNRTKALVKEGYPIKSIPLSVIKLAQSFVEDKETDILDLMKKSLDKLYDSFEQVTDGVTRMAESRANLPMIANQLNKEVMASTQFISNVQKIYKKAV